MKGSDLGVGILPVRFILPCKHLRNQGYAVEPLCRVESPFEHQLKVTVLNSSAQAVFGGVTTIAWFFCSINEIAFLSGCNRMK